MTPARSAGLCATLDSLGDVYRSSGRVAEAKSIYDRAIALRERRLKDNPSSSEAHYMTVSSRRRRGLSLRDLGDYAGAAADTRQALRQVDGITAPSSWPHHFEIACCHAVLAGLAGQAGSGVSTEEGEKAVAKAMEFLRRSIANGLRNPNDLRIESALDPLRDRTDFKKLVTELEKNAPTQQVK